MMQPQKALGRGPAAALTGMALALALSGSAHAQPDSNHRSLRIVTLDSPSPILEVKVMVRAGSTADPPGKEGLANLVAQALVQGSFGDPADPVTKEELAEITQPWGGRAMPSPQVAADTTTLHMSIPRDVLPEYVDRVLRPMLAQPLFAEPEIDRLKGEALAQVSVARYEDLENLGLTAIGGYVMQGTRYQHPTFGTQQGIPAISRQDVLRFYRTHYRPEHIILGVSTTDPEAVEQLAAAVRAIESPPSVLPSPPDREPDRFTGRQVLVVAVPNAPGASIHLGFPIDVTRNDADFWPLYVANTWLGTHRDSSGRLYQAIRQERGYNYGDYSYIEHWDGRPANLFQVFNQPRHQQYFSIWLRPVQPPYAYHLMKAATYELDRLVQEGLTGEQVAAAKRKARVLYLNLAETVDRLLAAKIDDAFYGTDDGFLEGYLKHIEAVTPEQVNQAIRRHLQTDRIRYVVATDPESARELVEQIRADRPALGKSLEDYQLTKVELEGGVEAWQIPVEKVDMLRLDTLWAHFPLHAGQVHYVPVESLFVTGELVSPAPGERE